MSDELKIFQVTGQVEYDIPPVLKVFQIITQVEYEPVPPGTFKYTGNIPIIVTPSSPHTIEFIKTGTSPVTVTPASEHFQQNPGEFIYLGNIGVTVVPQAVIIREWIHVGTTPCTITPQAVSGRTRVYAGNVLFRLTPIATCSLAGAVVPNIIPASTGGFALGGAGVQVSITPTDTEIPGAVEPTGFYLGGGVLYGQDEIISTVPGTDEIVTGETGLLFCGLGVTGDAETTEPSQDVIELETEGGFAFGGAGVLIQIKPEEIPSTILVGSAGFYLAGSGLTLTPGTTPTITEIIGSGGLILGAFRPTPLIVTYPGGADRTIVEPIALELGGGGTWGDNTPETTAIVGTGRFELGRFGPPPIEVTYPEIDRTIEETVAFVLGGEGFLRDALTPTATIIVSEGAIFALSGAGLATTRMPPIAVITGDAIGGFVLAGVTPVEVFEAWVLSGQAFEPSCWSGFAFNSFAQHQGQTYAAGEDGVYLLGADTDAGETIHTGARIGPINFGSDRDKRVRSVQFGQGGNGTRVRVKTETGERVFAPERDENRVTISRDLQGREFVIDILDFEELSQCEIFPLLLARR